MQSFEKSYIVPAERQNLIVEYIALNKSAQIRELALRFGVSEATVRRDLDELTKQGKIERTHGGAICNGASTSYERLYSEKMRLMLDEKQRIATEAAKLVENGSTILLDSGTTTFLVAQALSNFEDLTVITYDLHIADAVALHPTSSMIISGGIRRGNDYHVLQGGIVDKFIRDLNVDIVFLGADAISQEAGVTNANMLEAATKQLAIRAGATKVLVTDHTKFGHTALAKVCDINEFNCVITDDGIEEIDAAWMRQSGTKLITI